MKRALSAGTQGRGTGMGLAVALLFTAAPLWAASSTLQNPVVTFSAAGSKTVQLEVCNTNGCTQETQTITVIDPRPAVTAASFGPTAPTPEAGQLVFLTGAGTGKPPLAFSWTATPAGGAPLPVLSGQSLWWNTVGVPPGDYTLTFQVTNASGTATAQLPITLAPPTALDFYTIAPCRLYDSRLGIVPLLSGVAKVIQATGDTCGIPAGARAVAVNVTIIDPTGLGNASFYPGNYPQPVASTVNFLGGTTRCNNAILPLATDGAGTLTTLLFVAGGGSANLAVDVSGYFMAEAAQ